MRPNRFRTIECTVLPAEPEPEAVYCLHPLKDVPSDFYAARTDRNIGWITRPEQAFLRRCKIAVAGCGGMGGALAEKFLRLGVGEVRIADSEVFDASNINRQQAATACTIGESKAFATASMLRQIAPDATLVVYPQGVTPETAAMFVEDANVICDEIEFWAVGSRIALHQAARTEGAVVFNCNTVGFGTRLFFFEPHTTAIEEVLGLTAEQAQRFEQRFLQKSVTPDEVEFIMNRVIAGLVPELPDYAPGSWGNSLAVRRRLSDEGKASIIATNPPLATGFLADRVLLYLLRNSTVRRTVEPLPSMPGYLYLDCAFMEARVQSGKAWWSHQGSYDDYKTG